ncbi:rhomboid-like protein [Streptomyces lasiicapitis]|uniref:rhomboid-like protein n=1 Tax=Streptomyces lasiicapitis TaxID=1923961 RepID=UPI00278C6677|nr:rhomboid-like protein [Streptomyces lasiicapitis]
MTGDVVAVGAGAAVLDAVAAGSGVATLDGVPSQAGRRASGAPEVEARRGIAMLEPVAVESLVDGSFAEGSFAGGVGGGAAGAGAAGAGAAGVRDVRVRVWAGLRGLRPWRLLPSPTGTPFTFGYALILLATSLLAEHADPSLVSSLHQGSSTDVAHLADRPVFVLVASALWIAGGIASPYAIGFVLVLTALERRIGGVRTAGVFLLGHMVATLATEVPVGLSVLAGHLPGSSLHRLDYGISFGVAASVGALAGLLKPWLGWAVLAGFGWMLVTDLVAFTDPMTNWGHLLALAVGVATWPLLRGRGVGGAAA